MEMESDPCTVGMSLNLIELTNRVNCASDVGVRRLDSHLVQVN